MSDSPQASESSPVHSLGQCSDSDSIVVKAIEGMQRTMETLLTKFLLEFKATKDKVEEDLESQEEVIEEVKDSITGAWTEIESMKSENGELKSRCQMYEGRITRLEKELSDIYDLKKACWT